MRVSLVKFGLMWERIGCRVGVYLFSVERGGRGFGIGVFWFVRVMEE